MISVDVATAIFIYLSITLFVLFALWVRFEHSAAFKKTASDDKEVLQTCPICSFVYVDSMHRDFSRCPQCGSLKDRDEKPGKNRR